MVPESLVIVYSNENCCFFGLLFHPFRVWSPIETENPGGDNSGSVAVVVAGQQKICQRT